MIERACGQLAVAFATAADRRDADAMARLFTEDGALSFGATAIEGRDAIRRVLAERWAVPLTAPRRHFVANITVEVIDAASANVVAYQLVAGGAEPGGGAAIHAIAEIRDHCVLTAEGWRIRERVTEWVVAAP
jgi:uncharacterized protein (TIGR02246 family)